MPPKAATSAAATPTTLGLATDFPHRTEVEKAFDDVRAAPLGTPGITLVPINAHPDVTKALSDALSFQYACATTYHSAGWWLSMPQIGLDGCGAHFKLAAVVATADACKIADLIVKTGGMPHLSAIPAPPVDFHSESESDPLRIFEMALAMTKVSYSHTHRLYELAIKHGSAHLADFAGNAARQASEKVRAAALYVSHLKAICPPPGQTGEAVDLSARIAKGAALKAFDRAIAVEDTDLAYAAAVELALPNSHVIGPKERSMVVQSLMAGRGLGSDPEARRALAMSKLNA